MLYFCIPVHNEAPTIGVLLWRIRKVFQEFSREYEVLVYDDASTDGTAETLAPYARVLPLTVIGGRERVGYARALEELLRAASRRTRYPRRDAIVTLQGDFTDQPEDIPELIRRFEGGADVVVAERPLLDAMPAAVRRLRRAAPWVLKPFAGVPGITDVFSTFRLYRVSVIRDMLRESRIAGPHTDGWAANAAILVRLARHARRIESVTLQPRYELRLRETRVRPWADAISILRTARELRSGRSSLAALTSAESVEPRPALEPPAGDARVPARADSEAAAEEGRERSRRSRRGGARGNRSRGEPGEPRSQRPAGEAAPANGGNGAPRGGRASRGGDSSATKGSGTGAPNGNGSGAPKGAASVTAKPAAEAGRTPADATEPGTASAASAPSVVPAQPLTGGDQQVPAIEGERPRRRSRGGRSRRRARSSDEGSNPS